MRKLAVIFGQATRIVSVFPTLETAAAALDRLIFQGFPLKNLFLIGNHLAEWEPNGTAITSSVLRVFDEAQVGVVSGTAQGLIKGLVAGNLLGSVTGVALGLGILALPGIGQIAFTSAIIFTLISGGVGVAAGGVIGAFIGLGLTEQQAKQCNDQLIQGKYLLIVNGTEQEIAIAEQLLKTQLIQH